MNQRTDEWYSARLGHLTASRIKDAIDTLKNGGDSEKRKNYRLELVAERLTGRPTEFFTNKFMQWGIDNESAARGAYEAHIGAFVDETGFVKHPSIEWAGASPDGLINDGLIEIKCPATTTHIKWMIDGEVPGEHIPQMLWQMSCTGAEWCDFVSYDPRMPEDLQIFIKRFEPTQQQIEKINQQAICFLDSVNELMEKIEKIGIDRFVK